MRKSMAAQSWEVMAPGSMGQAAISIHPSAVLDPSVQLAEGIVIHANVVIERGVKIGAHTIIHANSYIGEDCTIGFNTILHCSVTLREKTQVGNNVVMHAGVVIGSDGFGYAKEQNGINYKVPQVGYVVVEDGVEIGANTTIDRATLGTTTIRKHSKIGSLVQVGHNVVVGENSTVGNSVGICGSCKIGSEVYIGHGVGMVGHIKIGDHAVVVDGSGVSKDVQELSRIVGAPAVEEEEYQFLQAHIKQLPEMLAKIHELEKKIEQASGETKESLTGNL
jgi:UDP-3-O-[3-hydroxymyristoyl] glucosamine N-acyltransferase